MFQHTAARRRLLYNVAIEQVSDDVSTHSRPKAAAIVQEKNTTFSQVSTHSRPKAAAPDGYCLPKTRRGFNTQPPEGGCVQVVHYRTDNFEVSTHSRPKAAAFHWLAHRLTSLRFNTQPPEGGCSPLIRSIIFPYLFQHTAARRRLHDLDHISQVWVDVSTHSRPKAAAPYLKKQEKSAD